MDIIRTIDIIVFVILSFFIGYDLFFVLASFRKKNRKITNEQRLQHFAIIFAAHRDDGVIVETVEQFLQQDYPKELYQVVVVSDHMSNETNRTLGILPIELMITDFEQSMKYKSICYALKRLEQFDRVIIMDSDNITDTSFLSQINNYTQRGIVLQTHRTYKNQNTYTAIWDSISEEINNTIYRKGRINVGLSSALIGSGMVFDFCWLKENMERCNTFAEDKELEILLAAQNVFIDYADDILVYDEKTSQNEIMAKQRSRWFHAQILAFSLALRYLKSKKSLNSNYIDKMLQWIPFPRVLKLTVIMGMLLLNSIQFYQPGEMKYEWLILLLITIFTYLGAIPKNMFTRELSISIFRFPEMVLVLIKSYYLSIRRVKNKDNSFQKTPHHIVSSKQENEQ